MRSFKSCGKNNTTTTLFVATSTVKIVKRNHKVFHISIIRTLSLGVNQENKNSVIIGYAPVHYLSCPSALLNMPPPFGSHAFDFVIVYARKTSFLCTRTVYANNYTSYVRFKNNF